MPNSQICHQLSISKITQIHSPFLNFSNFKLKWLLLFGHRLLQAFFNRVYKLLSLSLSILGKKRQSPGHSEFMIQT